VKLEKDKHDANVKKMGVEVEKSKVDKQAAKVSE
jgi:hypothetical protein